MITFRKPTDELLQSFVHTQSKLDYTYRGVGTTASVTPSGYQLDQSRFTLGHGEQVFQRAQAALRNWQQFNLGWARAFPGNTPIAAGQTVAVIFYRCGLWFTCSARIVYAVNEPRQFGFAYGTLPGHIESGEERFLVGIDEDGVVWYEIRAFSRPSHILTKLGYPYVRRLQKWFVRESAAAMQDAVA